MTIHSNSQREYFSRIQNVIKYIDQNLDSELSLNTLAEAAFFSPFHFHRIFTSILNETPQEFVKRIRLERAANMLLTNHKDSITDIALECGFSSSSVFSRAFKNHFNISASKWKTSKLLKDSKISKVDSNISKELTSLENYFESLNNYSQNNIRSSKMSVEVKKLPSYNVAYAANLEGYKIDKIKAAWQKLTGWAGPKNLINDKTVFIGVSYDNPEITDPDKCRYYACITIPEEVETSDGIGKMTIDGGLHGVMRFKGHMNEIENVYTEFFGKWLPQSGYQPTNAPFDIYYKSPEVEPKGYVEIDLCVPIKAL